MKLWMTLLAALSMTALTACQESDDGEAEGGEETQMEESEGDDTGGEATE